MADSNLGAGRTLRYGCVGCVGVVGILLLLAGATVGVAWMQARGETIEDRLLTHELNGSPEQHPPATALVALDLAHAEFELRAGLPGEPLSVEASYDTRWFELHEGRSLPGPWRRQQPPHP